MSKELTRQMVIENLIIEIAYKWRLPNDQWCYFYMSRMNCAIGYNTISYPDGTIPIARVYSNIGSMITKVEVCEGLL